MYVVLASEPVGERSRATELPCCFCLLATSGTNLSQAVTKHAKQLYFVCVCVFNIIILIPKLYHIIEM